MFRRLFAAMIAPGVKARLGMEALESREVPAFLFGLKGVTAAAYPAPARPSTATVFQVTAPKLVTAAHSVQPPATAVAGVEDSPNIIGVLVSLEKRPL